MPLTLETVQVENSLKLGNGTYEKYQIYRIGTNEVQAVSEPVLTARYDEPVSVLAAEGRMRLPGGGDPFTMEKMVCRREYQSNGLKIVDKSGLSVPNTCWRVTL